MTSVIRVGQIQFALVPIDEGSVEQITTCLQALARVAQSKPIEAWNSFYGGSNQLLPDTKEHNGIITHDIDNTNLRISNYSWSMRVKSEWSSQKSNESTSTNG
ncbi:hypothetical protein KEM48_002333 [Puccinia striiformis f. sp. tritici PST-130]|uniref:Uncharacterized protein n=2 Tax=Puccinia striiformis TaxID=27350 RepID=A0A0L0VLJ8_9BASI|nr:hypothetical protein KEM48_002424 [Puccinia striiformis f. sp. tritici PST-130]KAI9604702.1 hypothetical protein KEM48_002333 [Puccinia striiformis f. sp. tritici PST-130]KNE99879.1 hypothetical protein PSTG_06968 [Puccinia striiformis f. sp. tritici PST-78]POW00370.1 hypothetical protein PSTT_13172 [Puccinia striiformis]